MKGTCIMTICFGRDICSQLDQAEAREWLVTNGIGGYASGTIAGLLTRRYHGLMIAPINPPLDRKLLFSKVDETVLYGDRSYDLFTNRWQTGVVAPEGYRHIQSFQLEGTIPTWTFACADALLEKRIWMQQGANTTYLHYHLRRASQPVTLSLKLLVNYRDHHGSSQVGYWQMGVEAVEGGLKVTAFPKAMALYLLTDRGAIAPAHEWYRGFFLAQEAYRGLSDHEDHLYVGTLTVTLQPGESLTLAGSTDADLKLDGQAALADQRAHESSLIQQWQQANPAVQPSPDWVNQLVLAADQFIVARSLPYEMNGQTVIAGYPWFGDWGRDTMIALTGLTLTTGRSPIAATILRTFSRFLDQGMLPNLFPDGPQKPEYNTVDAILWYFEAIRAYHAATQDDELLMALYPGLAVVVEWHLRGTRYQIHVDPADGLLYAGEPGVQLTWMDAKVGDWVVTPRIGKPIEINALWYNALCIMVQLGQRLGKPVELYQNLAQQVAKGFQRFWNETAGYCYDVLDTPEGDDLSLRPNQIFAVSLPVVQTIEVAPLLNARQQQAVVDTCGRVLLTSHGLRSLSPDDASYIGHYGGNVRQRDGAYHQGTVWGWLIGAFVQAHVRVYGDRAAALSYLEPMMHQLKTHCVGTLSEIFDGDAPMTPRGTIAQAWSVAEVLRTWVVLTTHSSKD
jgi:predicted glycogen debranching enzyme